MDQEKHLTHLIKGSVKHLILRNYEENFKQTLFEELYPKLRHPSRIHFEPFIICNDLLKLQMI